MKHYIRFHLHADEENVKSNSLINRNNFAKCDKMFDANGGFCSANQNTKILLAF